MNTNIKYNLGIILVFSLQIISVILFLSSPGVSLDKNNFTSFFGNLFAVLGMSLFATSLILSARYKFLENIFYGLNKVYKYHGRIGKTAFYLMLFHPFLVFYSYFGNLNMIDFLNFITPREGNWAVGFGTIGLSLLIILISLTIYFRPKYHIWKRTHKLMGLAFFFGGLHAFLVPGNVSSFLPLKIYMLTLAGFGIFSYIYHTVLGFYTTKKYSYLISSVLDLGENITEVRLKPTGETINFTPGQYAFISFLDKNITPESHPFSFSSNINSNEISFTIKNLGDYTSKIKDLKENTIAKIEGPFGKFSYKEALDKKQIWIAGGIGITPFLSMAKSIKEEDDFSVDLYYCVRNEKEAVYLEELIKLKNDKLNIIPHFSDSMGFINANIIKEKSGLIERSIFICSPVPMIKILRKQFIEFGILNNKIHSEEFSL